MNIAVNGIDDVQDANDTDKDDKHPAQHFDLCKAFYHLIAALEIGKPMCSWIIAAPAIQPAFKGICIGVIL